MDNPVPNPKSGLRDIRFEEPTFIDPLTGLFNQYYLYQFLPEELKKAKLARYPLAVLMIDLDGFKGINDSYGHLCGDDVLKQLSAILKNAVRKTDMVIRYAGDEFTILLPTADQNTASMLSKRFIQDVQKTVFKGKDGQELHLTISIGFSIFPTDGERIDELIELADRALYLSKQKGKNRVSYAKEVNIEAVSYMVAMDSFPCPKFIDRTEELDKLKYIFDAIVIKSNLLQVAFISGEMGRGKSRLLSEIGNYARERAAMIHCRASLSHMQDPYYLFANGITDYIQRTGLDKPQLRLVFSQIPPEELDALSLLVVPLSGMAKGSIELEQEEGKRRFLLFKAFLDFLIELNKTQVIFLSFDDLQWADKASLELLHYLGQQEKTKRIFIASCYSLDKYTKTEKKEGLTLQDLLEEMKFEDNCTNIVLDNFSLEETKQMNSAIFPGLVAPEQFYETMYNATKGNPSFIEELLKLLVENGVVLYQDNRWQIKKDFEEKDMPTTIDDLIKKRIKNIDEETKEMIVQAAVAGDDFSVELLKKVGNKDEGFTLELLNRAKKMRLIDELEPKGKYGFINKNIQNMLYNELDEKTRNQLHYAVGNALIDQYKKHEYKMAGELAFHFGNASVGPEAAELRKQLSAKTHTLFNPSEMVGYLDQLAKEVMVEKDAHVVALSDIMQTEALRFVRALQSAIKNFQLYPPGSIRVRSLKEAYAALDPLWKESERLNLGEVERVLVINGKRITPKEVDRSNVEFFVSQMLEHNLKTISFIKGVTEQDLDKFLQYFSRPYQVIKDEGGWGEVVKKESLGGIKVDEVRFIQIGGPAKAFEEKKRIEDIMLMEFLLGKIENESVDKNTVIDSLVREPKKFAQTIADASAEAVKAGPQEEEAKDGGKSIESQAEMIAKNIEKINSEILGDQPRGRNYAKNLAQVIMELDPDLRSKLIRSPSFRTDMRQHDIIDNVMKGTPKEVVADMIVEEYKEHQGNLLVARDFMNSVLKDSAKKEEVLAELETKLSNSNVSAQDIEFMTGQLSWEDLPAEKRIENLMKLPDEYYQTELDKIKELLEDLDAQQKKAELEKLLLHLITKASKLLPLAHKNLMLVLIDFVKRPLIAKDKTSLVSMEDRLNVFLKRAHIELDQKTFSDILEVFKGVIRESTNRIYPSKNIMLEIDKPEIKKYFSFTRQLFVMLASRQALEKEKNPTIYRLIGAFLNEITYTEFLETFIQAILNSPAKEKEEFRSVFPLIASKAIDALIRLEDRSAHMFGDSFREYVIRKSMADFLQELGEQAVNLFLDKCAVLKDEMSEPLIELLGYLKKPRGTELLVLLLRHNDLSMRRSALLALGDVGTEKAVEAITTFAQIEEDKKLRQLAKEQLARLKKAKIA